MEKQIDVLTIADLNVDLVAAASDVVPEFGQKEKFLEDYSFEMGGSCSIFACQTAKLGLKTAVVGRIGSDIFSNIVVDTLRQSGVITDYINKEDGLKTGISIHLSNGSDRAILTYMGSIDSVVKSDISNELLSSVRHIHVGSYFLMKKIQPHYVDILKKARQYGATVSLDINWDPEETWDSGINDVLPLVDIFFPNENEAMAVTKENTAEKAINKLRGIVPIVAVKKGKDGAYIYDGKNKYSIPSIDVEKVDAVGAGDSFDGGFVYGYLSGKSIEECGRIGCICGSLNTRSAGGTKGQPALEEVLKYL
jgi:sugar/nucleoside kinase (ribokinase family)